MKSGYKKEKILSNESIVYVSNCQVFNYLDLFINFDHVGTKYFFHFSTTMELLWVKLKPIGAPKSTNKSINSVVMVWSFTKTNYILKKYSDNFYLNIW